jgi:hypothetical protein
MGSPAPPGAAGDPIPRPPGRYGSEGDFKTFLCPSAPDSRSPGVAVIIASLYSFGQPPPPQGGPGVDYPAAYTSGNGTTAFFTGAPSRDIFGRTNYLAMSGDSRAEFVGGMDYYKFRGLFYYKSKEQLAATADGTSNTMLFGEASGGGNPFNATQPCNGSNVPSVSEWVGYAWLGATLGYSAFGLGDGSCSGANDWGKYASFHNNLILFAYADGSVRPLSNPAQYNSNPTFQVLRAMGGAKDGKVIIFDN